MERVIVDCAAPAIQQRRDFTQAEQDEYDARQLLPPPMVGMNMAVGRVDVSVIDGTTKAVIFPQALRSADYVVMLNPTSSLSANLWATNKTVTGFILNLSLAVTGTIEYIAHEVTK